MSARSLMLSGLFVLAACNGRIMDAGDDSIEDLSSDERPEATGAAFDLSESAPRLLPLEARLHRLAQVFETDVSDARFDVFREQAVALGGYDFSAQLAPDDRWSAQRMTLWVQLVHGVCESEAQERRYDDNDELLLTRAWGRAPSAEDVRDFEETLSELPNEARARVRCIAALSSAETVTQ